MMSGKDAAAVSNLSFETMLDDVCGQLWDRKVNYSLRRIREMDALLAALEQELDALILQGKSRPGPSGGKALQDQSG
ncbi:MAG: hypothetical protein LBH57_00345 [Treponema sp.]|jgi:hypothetical protein|nr:hypothetical protein [Treponema sp.]